MILPDMKPAGHSLATRRYDPYTPNPPTVLLKVFIWKLNITIMQFNSAVSKSCEHLLFNPSRSKPDATSITRGI